jgi:hypothetical protein
MKIMFKTITLSAYLFDYPVTRIEMAISQIMKEGKS